MLEFPAFLPPTNLGLLMHSPSALTEHVSLNLARFYLLNPVNEELQIIPYPGLFVVPPLYRVTHRHSKNLLWT